MDSAVSQRQKPSFFALFRKKGKQKELLKIAKDSEELKNLGGINGVAKALQTDIRNGFSNDEKEIAERRRALGSNLYGNPSKTWQLPSEDYKRRLSEALQKFTSFKDLVSILVYYILAVATLVVGISKVPSQKLTQFRKRNSTQIDIVRGGTRQQICTSEIVVGDVICLKIGDQVPADGLLIKVNRSLFVDKSSFTGDSDRVEINHEQDPFLFSGSQVVGGSGRMLVTSVGMSTELGKKINQNSSQQQSSLEAKLDKLAYSIRMVSLIIVFLVTVALVVRYFTGNTKDEYGHQEFENGSTAYNEVFKSTVFINIGAFVTIFMVAISEGLRLTTALIISFSKMRMMADMEMVSDLSACDTMASVTTICTNKTGTLTMNQMKVNKFWLGQDLLEQVAYNSSVSRFVIDLFQEGIASYAYGMEYSRFSGIPTEKAILSWAVEELNMDMEEVTSRCTVLRVEAFDPLKRRSGVLLKRNADNNTVHVHWKGAAEIILQMCSSYYNASGNIIHLDGKQKKMFQDIIEGMAASSLQCIAFAHNGVPAQGDEDSYKTLEEDGLVLLGLMGIKDPCRPGVKKAVEGCQNARINVKMITGDNIFIAKAIATECGILGPGHDMDGAVIEGVEFRNYSFKERMEKVDKIRVMARASPEDKLLFVESLKQRDHVVAVVGNGRSDVLALTAADIGISLGIPGNEVAKKASGIVILDDNFASVTTALQWSRCIYNNIQKFLQFQLTLGIAAFAINSIAAVSAGEVLLNSAHLLWLYLILNTTGALALATEKPTKEIMEKPPMSKTEPLISNIMWRNLAAQVLYQNIVVLILVFAAKSILGGDILVRNTFIFNAVLLCQVFNQFNARKLEKKNVFKGIHRDISFLFIISVTIFVQVLIVELLQPFETSTSLNWKQWLACYGIAFLSWPFDCIFKFIPVQSNRLQAMRNQRERKNF